MIEKDNRIRRLSMESLALLINRRFVASTTYRWFRAGRWTCYCLETDRLLHATMFFVSKTGNNLTCLHGFDPKPAIEFSKRKDIITLRMTDSERESNVPENTAKIYPMCRLKQQSWYISHVGFKNVESVDLTPKPQPKHTRQHTSTQPSNPPPYPSHHNLRTSRKLPEQVRGERSIILGRNIEIKRRRKGRRGRDTEQGWWDARGSFSRLVQLTDLLPG